ncbi:MAG: hypothetical protein IPJ65_07190 [Archangiaceae bacterium]|nr:hypothetical protein [Archangiaceae bacterium]
MSIDLGTGDVTFKPAGEAQREAKASDLRERLIAFVSASAEPLTKNKICTGVKGTKTEKLNLIDTLTTEGVFRNDGAGWTAAPKEPKP